ncbi:uncharacterized protein HD556DRAFT_1307291 [Suillus plorans]|uniref:Uncharacterized protein n=1 Tax=Suillus plorans TaxID=116603 RepID=A0A9P7AVP5_9AGAM|nr:uncharacterized protein HD556DRAFT_1307291 [Suillus plorans]KAG1796084.1 hypothetical protein HD556DRAFT_1307291 [Suillus plorans]
MICTIQTDESDHTSHCATPPTNPSSHSRETTASTPKVNAPTKTKATKTTEFEVSVRECRSSFEQPLTPEALATFNAAQARTGVIYISRIPPGMRPVKVRHLMSARGEVGRVYFQQEADINFHSPRDVQPPWLDDEFEKWYWLDYTLKLG